MIHLNGDILLLTLGHLAVASISHFSLSLFYGMVPVAGERAGGARRRRRTAWRWRQWRATKRAGEGARARPPTVRGETNRGLFPRKNSDWLPAPEACRDNFLEPIEDSTRRYDGMKLSNLHLSDGMLLLVLSHGLFLRPNHPCTPRIEFLLKKVNHRSECVQLHDETSPS